MRLEDVYVEPKFHDTMEAVWEDYLDDLEHGQLDDIEEDLYNEEV